MASLANLPELLTTLHLLGHGLKSHAHLNELLLPAARWRASHRLTLTVHSNFQKLILSPYYTPALIILNPLLNFTLALFLPLSLLSPSAPLIFQEILPSHFLPNSSFFLLHSAHLLGNSAV